MKIFRRYHFEPLSKLSELLESFCVVAVGEIDSRSDEEISRELKRIKKIIQGEHDKDEFLVILVAKEEVS